MTTFVIMQNRIASEINRSTLTTEIKAAINDAIKEASKDRFWFNEVKGVTFNTAATTEYYTLPQELTEIDFLYYTSGGQKYEIYLANNAEIDQCSVMAGTPLIYARHAAQIRLSPVPDTILAIYADGYGRLLPDPLSADADTNAWMVEGERYIRALAKAIIYRDKIRDFTESAVFEAISEDIKEGLMSQTTLRLGTGVLQATRF